MAEPIARVHVNDFDPEVYKGERALEYALIAAAQFRKDFPGAIVGVSYNPEAAAAKKADILARLGLRAISADEYGTGRPADLGSHLGADRG